MICTTVMNNIIEERNQLCICLARIAKERDIKNKEKWELGEETQEKLDLFTIPNHIKRMFGDFLKTPLYTEIKTLNGHTDGVSCLTLSENKMYSGSYDHTIRIWNTETYEEIATLNEWITESLSELINNVLSLPPGSERDEAKRILKQRRDTLFDASLKRTLYSVCRSLKILN